MQDGDLLISSAGEPGLTTVWKKKYEQKAIPGSFVTVARMVVGVNPLYAGVFLNTVAGQLQFERNYSGSVQQYVYPSKIKEILVPILSKEIQQKIVELVQKSHDFKKHSKELLEEAKAKVEQLIENK